VATLFIVAMNFCGLNMTEERGELRGVQLLSFTSMSCHLLPYPIMPPSLSTALRLRLSALL
jgi:hypothetical protein